MGKKLYFIKGPASQADMENARLAGAVIRDANAWHEGDYIEQCDEVLGDINIIPAPYRHLFKNTEQEQKPEQSVKANSKKRKKMPLVPLIVEDGKYPEDANSYASLEDADQYLVGRGLWPVTPEVETGTIGEGNSDTESEEKAKADANENTGIEADANENSKKIIAAKEIALIRAFDYLNGPLQWLGRKVDWKQAPAWPRIGVPIPGLEPVQYIEPNYIPKAVKQAQMELAALIFNGRDMFAPVEHGGNVKSISNSSTKTLDVLAQSQSHSITYADGAPVEAWLPAVYPLLRDFLDVLPGEAKNEFQCGIGIMKG